MQKSNHITGPIDSLSTEQMIALVFPEDQPNAAELQLVKQMRQELTSSLRRKVADLRAGQSNE